MDTAPVGLASRLDLARPLLMVDVAVGFHFDQQLQSSISDHSRTVLIVGCFISKRLAGCLHLPELLHTNELDLYVFEKPIEICLLVRNGKRLCLISTVQVDSIGLHPVDFKEKIWLTDKVRTSDPYQSSS